LEAIVTAATSRLRRRGIGAGVSALVGLTSVVGLAAAAHAAPGFTFPSSNRVAGADRYATAIAASNAAFPTGTQAGGVVLVSGTSTVDGLTASYVAGSHNAPILLVKNGVVDADTMAEITRLNVTNVWIVGGTSVVPEGVSTQLMGKTIVRYNGADRYETASKAATDNGTVTTQPGKVFIASGTADALAAAPVLYNKKYPLLLTRPASVPATTADALTQLTTTNHTVLGGTTAVEAGTYTALGGTARLQGANRYETATAIAASAVANEGFSGANVAIANGMDAAAVDSLTGSVVAGKNGVPLIFANGTDVSPAATTAYLTANNSALTGQLYVFGGTSVVSAAAATAVVTTATAPVASSITVAPSAAATQIVSTGTAGETNRGARTYTATGLDNTKTYSVLLVPAASVLTSATGVVTFTSGAAAAAGGGVSIETVNGVAGTLADGSAGVTQVNGVTPISGGISFSVDSVVPGSVVPVVFLDANADGALNFKTVPTTSVPQAPSETFAVGGALTWNPTEASAGALGGNALISSVDKTAKQIVTAAATYNYDANDTFYVGGTAASNQVTLAQFEAVLSAGDSLVAPGTTYTTNPAFVSNFVLANNSPAAPTLSSSVSPSDVSAVLTVTSASVLNGATVNVYRAAGTSGTFANATKVAAATVDADTATADFQINVAGLTATTGYTFFVTQTVGGEESGASSAATTTTTQSVDAAATITAVSPGDINNGVGSTATVIVTYAKALAGTGTALTGLGGITVAPTNQAGFTLGATATSISTDRKTVTYTLDNTATLDDASTDIAYTVTVAASAAPTADGPNGRLTASFSY